MLPENRQTRRAVRKGPGPCIIYFEIGEAQQRPHLAEQLVGFRRNCCFPPVGIGQSGFFAARQNAIIGGRAHVEIRISGFPDQTTRWPEPIATNRLCGDGPRRYDFESVARYASDDFLAGRKHGFATGDHLAVSDRQPDLVSIALDARHLAR